MPKSKNRRKKKKKPIDYSSQKNRKTSLERDISIAEKTMTKKYPETKVKIVESEHSVSGLILDYGKVYINECITEDDCRKALALLIACWNIGSLPEDKREQALSGMLTAMPVDEIEDVIRDLIHKKVSFYDEYKYYVTDFELSFKGKDMLNLSVSSLILDAEGNPRKE